MAAKKLTPQQVSYRKKLQSPKWQKKRLEIFNRDDYTCQACGWDDSPLHVHHMKYNNCDPWDIDNKFLITLCEGCHEWETDNYKARLEQFLDVLKSRRVFSHHLRFLAEAFEESEISVDSYTIEVLKFFFTNVGMWRFVSKHYDVHSKGETNEFLESIKD